VDTIFVEAIEFYGYHGASDEEQAVGHRYSVDLALEVDTRNAGASDRLEDTVNYATVAHRVVEIGTGERCRLVEALAARLAATILAEFPVSAVRVRVRKLHPPMNVMAASVGVEIRRSTRD
jgi:7,8-dihydroneopterin aldolase/epimerase/oxygenase